MSGILDLLGSDLGKSILDASSIESLYNVSNQLCRVSCIAVPNTKWIDGSNERYKQN